MNEPEFVFEPHDVIYLQTGPEGYEDWENFEYEGVTWCQDQINDGDTKYLLATPVRESAEALLKACEFFMKGLLDLVEIGALANKEYDAAAIKYVDEMHQLVIKVKMMEASDVVSEN